MDVVTAEHARIAPRLAELKARLQGKRVFVSAGQARALSISNFADELGFELPPPLPNHKTQRWHSMFRGRNRNYLLA